MNLVGKTVVVYGAGISGISAAALARDHGARAIIYDDNPKKSHSTSCTSVFNDCDVLVVSPGVPSGNPHVLDAKLAGKQVLGEMEFASLFCAAEQIAVTGTNGKTTAFSSVADKLDAMETVVIEASSFQLEGVTRFAPDIAVMLNITPDHLDRHGNMQRYIGAKAGIFLRQSESDVAVYNADDENVLSLLPVVRARKVPFSVSHPVDGAYLSSGFVCWKGMPVAEVGDTDFCGRELEDVLAAVAVAAVKNVGLYTVASALASFSRPEFRRAACGEVDGVKIFNDSKATNVLATVSAAEGMRGDTVLILGGADRGEDFDAIPRCGEPRSFRRLRRCAGYGKGARVLQRALFSLLEKLRPIHGIRRTRQSLRRRGRAAHADEMKRTDFFAFDKSLALCAVLLSGIGLLFIYSASSYSAELQFGDAFHYVETQAVALVLGVAVMLALSFVRPERIKKAALPLYIAGIALLAAVFIPGFGVENYGAKRWLDLGFFTVQPSEYAKFAMVVLLAAFAAKRGVGTFPRAVVFLSAAGAVCLLLLLEPNMSVTICVGAAAFLLLFAAGAKPTHLVLILVPVVVCGTALVVAEPYRVRRLLAFLDPWASPLDEGYQLIQSYYALGSGGLFGVGLFSSRQKYLFLPFAESDFILSVIGEETGFFGVMGVLALFGVIVVRGALIAARARDAFSCYLSAGITALLAVQTLMNAAVVCGAVPPTGLPLPFVSAGGSSLVCAFAAVGVLLAVSRHSSGIFLRLPEAVGAPSRKTEKTREIFAGGRA